MSDPVDFGVSDCVVAGYGLDDRGQAAWRFTDDSPQGALVIGYRLGEPLQILLFSHEQARADLDLPSDAPAESRPTTEGSS